MSVTDHAGDLSRSTAFTELSGLLAAGRPADAILLRVAQSLKQCVAGVADVSVSMIDELGSRTVAFTGVSAIELDEAQYDLQHGPCLDAARTQRTVVVNTGSDTTYPEFSRLAQGQGVRHSLSIGLPVVGAAAGLNVYGDAGERFPDEAVTVAGAFANYAFAAISRPAQAADPAPPAGWQAAMGTRAVVDRAALTVMASRSCTREEALQQLLGVARSQRRRLADVAESIVQR